MTTDMDPSHPIPDVRTSGRPDDRTSHIMPLGDHLEELRRRLFIVLGVTILLAVGGSLMFRPLLALVEWPLRRGMALCDPQTLTRIGLPADLAGGRLLKGLSLGEAPFNIFKIAFLLALFVALPLALHQLWKFIAPGLYPRERKAIFFSLPAAVICFYVGALVGYLWGLPWFFAGLIGFNDLMGVMVDLRQTAYVDLFVVLVGCFGVVMCIPWIMLILVRARLITAATLAKRRRIILFCGVVVAAIITPPDPISQLVMFGIMVILFELGLLLCRWIGRPQADAAKETA